MENKKHKYYSTISNKEVKFGDRMSYNGFNFVFTPDVLYENPNLFKVEIVEDDIKNNTGMSFTKDVVGESKEFLMDGASPLFITKDNIKIYNEEEILFGCSKNIPYYHDGSYINVKYKHIFKGDLNTFYWFSTEYNRQKWVIEHSKYIQLNKDLKLLTNKKFKVGEKFYKDNIINNIKLNELFTCFEPITEKEYVNSLIKKFKEKRPYLDYDNINFKYDKIDHNLEMRYKNLINLIVYSVKQDKWIYDFYITKNDEIVRFDEYCFYLDTKSIEPHKNILNISKLKFIDLLETIEDKNDSVIFDGEYSLNNYIISKSKKKVEDEWYKIKRKEYINKIKELYPNLNKKDQSIKMLELIASDCNNGWKFEYNDFSCLCSIIYYDYEDNKFDVIDDIKRPSITDVLFKCGDDAETAIKIMAEYLYELVK